MNTEETKPRKVYGNQAFRLQEKLIAAIDEAWSHGRHFHLTFDQIRDRLQERVWVPAQRLGAAEYQHLRGYSRYALKEVYQHLVWVMSCDGKLMTREEVDALTKDESNGLVAASQPGYKSPWARIENDKSTFVWIGKDGKPLKDKPFSLEF